MGRRRPRIGFTLLEVLLTLAMSVVLMVLIGGAIQFYARDLNASNVQIRQVQVGAAVLQMIEDDLRAAMHPEPIDTAALASLLASAAAPSSGGGGGGGGASEDLSAAGVASDETLPPDTGLPVDLVSGASVLQRPGLIGSEYQIQVDISRLPRLEEYMVMLDETAGDIDDIPSDLKTVTYFVQSAGITGVADSLGQFDAETASGGASGLVRRSLDRAVTTTALTSGGLTTLNQTGELIAPEVVSLEFSYWDGLMWQLQWNSDEMGELPLAVRVQIAVVDAADTATSAEGTTTETASEPRLFTHIVRLPLARPVDLTDDTLTGAGL